MTPDCDEQPAHGNQRVLFLVRFGAIIGIVGWALSVLFQISSLTNVARDILAGLVAPLLWYAAYSVGLYLAVRKFPRRFIEANIAALPLDAAFISLLIHHTGGGASSFYLVYYIFIAVATFYFGVSAGAFATLMSTAGYLAVFFISPNSFYVGDLLLRLVTMFILYFILATGVENEKRDKALLATERGRIGELNARLEEGVNELIDEKETLARSLGEKADLLHAQKEITERRRAHIAVAREISAQAEPDAAALIFMRYAKDLVGADDLSMILLEDQKQSASLCRAVKDRITREDISMDHPLLALFTGEDVSERVWPGREGESVPAGMSVAAFETAELIAEPLLGGAMGLVGLVVMASKSNSGTDAEKLDEVRILGAHLAVALENLLLRRRLQEMADTDGLTGLWNHRTFRRTLEVEMTRAERYRREVSVLLLDIDFFKKINDTHGHPAGDAVLRELAKSITSTLRKVDLAARYGGEEFAVILPETPLAGARDVAERLRRDVEAMRIKISADTELSVTISVGVATFPTTAGGGLTEIVKSADNALYEAKNAGRNCVRLAQPPLAKAV